MANELRKVRDSIYRLSQKQFNYMCHDDAWQNVGKFISAIKNLEGVTDVSTWHGVYHNYLHSASVNSSPYRTYKILVETPFGDLGGQITCSAAGTMEDPFSTYDMNIIIDRVRDREEFERLGENTIKEEAKSKAQQRFFGMVDAYKKGEMPNASDSIKDAAEGMSMKDVKDFAETKHKGLPNHVKKNKKKVKEITEKELKDLVSESVKKVLNEAQSPAKAAWASIAEGLVNIQRAMKYRENEQRPDSRSENGYRHVITPKDVADIVDYIYMTLDNCLGTTMPNLRRK